MSIIMALFVLFGIYPNTPLTADEQITKACAVNGHRIECDLNEKGCGETWKHSQPQTPSADREIER